MASMSKRTQARNERELHELLRLPGNSQCADCGASNPAWASWNLGIFLCMRCASLHRKLGTHISKVKSLSMDTWTAEQVENMKRNGNIAVNKVYNPKNKKPDIPLDADEVDAAMERFIRKKYQEKSLSDGKPEPPQRDDAVPQTYSRPEERERDRDRESPPPPLPPKKGRFFGFGLRATSSISNLKKHDKKKLPREPRVDGAFPISSDDYTSMSRMADARFEMTDAELQDRLDALRDMGFTDTERNMDLLRRLGGNVERTIERLVQEGPSDSTKSSAARRPDQRANGNSRTASSRNPGPSASSEPSYNPFTQMTNQETVGLSLTKPQQSANPPGQAYQSNNPFGPVANNQPQTGLEQSFQSMQLGHPLFPHSTGGYPSQPAPLQDPRSQYSMTPPVPSTHFPQGYVASPAAMPMNTNPFFESSTGAPQQSTGNNPFMAQAAAAPTPSASSINPFFSAQSFQPAQAAPMQQQRQFSLPTNLNPFGLPPSQASSQTTQNPMPSQFQQYEPATNNPFQQQQQQQQHQQQQSQPQSPQHQPPTSSFPQFGYGQPQTQPQSQMQPQQQMPQFQQQQQQFNQQPQPLTAQQTGRYDKNSILALYNYPQLAPKPLASIPEPGPEGDLASSSHQQSQQQPQQQQYHQQQSQHPQQQYQQHHQPQQQQQPQQQYQQPQQQQQLSPAPSGNIYNTTQPNAISLTPTRSATMPASMSISNMHSAGGGGSRNPFLMNTANTATNSNLNANHNPNNFPTPAEYGGYAGGYASGGGGGNTFTPASPTRPQGQGGMMARYRHASAESVSISNLDNGRHSPDAFASLSARSIR
ncbi:hypothetical protein A1O1_09067 [Capronia coronata CBS 617.96]|uniref:Arf-GAP domain-containing protein n=1 Tax=Capronia coronata CBS 617.96 TaxID=1182541 RepID=W9XNX2_9EURO|nr:uncharacterized protein A1O1_09067 [Capronia coronata CBS 617.96]EXJ78666.1 hypothetical protein A1O1_09067 [Capronia coronata CBS 617.96]